MLLSPTAMGIRSFTGLPSAIHFSISPATCQGQAADAVAASAVIHWRRPQAPGIICMSQFARLQKILNTALMDRNTGPLLFCRLRFVHLFFYRDYSCHINDDGFRFTPMAEKRKMNHRGVIIHLDSGFLMTPWTKQPCFFSFHDLPLLP